jgi:hypothetical protein
MSDWTIPQPPEWMQDAPPPHTPEGYDWEDFEDFRSVVQEYADTEPNGYLEKIDSEKAYEIAAKLAEVVRPWVKATQPYGTWDEMTRTMRMIVLNDITGLRLSSTKDLPAGFSHLADMLGADRWDPDPTVARMIREQFGF